MVALSSYWKDLTAPGSVIHCSEMTLLGGDHEPPIVQGEGEIIVVSTTRLQFELRGTPADPPYALKAIRRPHDEPYEGRARQRLIVQTRDELNLSCGWTVSETELPAGGFEWRFTGELQSISALEKGEGAHYTEVAFLIDHRAAAATILRQYLLDDPDVVPNSIRSINFDGDYLTLSLSEDEAVLYVRAYHSDLLRASYTENWIGEVFRILLGQPMYPRLVVRGLGDRMQVSVRPSPEWYRKSGLGLWRGAHALSDDKRFWKTFVDLVRFIASDKDDDGEPNWEENDVTAFFGEIALAFQSSTWLWAVSNACAIERLTKTIRSEIHLVPSVEITEIESLKSHIKTWCGDENLKNSVISSIDWKKEITAAHVLKELRDMRVIETPHLKAWRKLRNKTAHGELLDVYSSEQDDQMLSDLADLLTTLTEYLISRSPRAGRSSLPT